MNKSLSMSVDNNLNISAKDAGVLAASFTTENAVGYIDSSGTFDGDLSCWNYWEHYYYPNIIRKSYPVYIRERAEDKGRQAFEIIKMLNDKKLLRISEIKDFIKLMDELIKIL